MEDPTPTGGEPAGMPRWVKAFVVVGVLVALVALVAMLTGDGHGPGRHGRGAASAAGGR